MKIKHIIFLAIATLAIACEDKEINWKVDHIDKLLVVEGSFTDEFKKHQITLTLSEDYFVNRQTARVTDANVSITDGTNTINYVETAFPGIYETADPVAGTVGMTYTLNINLNTPVNGTSHYYCTSTMKPTIKIDSLYSFVSRNFMNNGDSLILVFAVFGQENKAKGDYYTCETRINNHMINDTIDEKAVFNDETSGLQGHNVNFFFIRTNDVKPGDTTRFSLFSVDRTYSDFVTGISQIANYNDPLGFSGPPANAIGNIQGGKALGYFMISSVSTGECIAIDEKK